MLGLLLDTTNSTLQYYVNGVKVNPLVSLPKDTEWFAAVSCMFEGTVMYPK